MADPAGVVESFVTASPSPVVTVPAAADPACSFVFVTYGTGPVIVTAISTLVASLDDEAYEVVIVDNEHPEHPDRTVRQLLVDTAGVRVLRPGENLGFAAGCNLGVQRSTGPLIGLLNPDVELPAGWLPPLHDALSVGAAIAAPVLVDPDGTVQSAGHRLWSDGSTSPVSDTATRHGAGGHDYASAACWLLTRAVFDELDGFDPTFHPAYYEDVDLALRARALGGTAVVDAVRVVHRRGASTTVASEPDTTPQRLHLLAKWPALVTTQPAPPG